MAWNPASSPNISTASQSISISRPASSTCKTSLTGAQVSLTRLQFPSQQCLASNAWFLADVEALREGTKYLKQLIPAVVNLVYKKMLRYDITSRAFHTRTTTDEKETAEEYLTEDTPQIKRRKMFLRWYLVRLCQDPNSMDFWRYLDKVGYVANYRRKTSYAVLEPKLMHQAG